MGYAEKEEYTRLFINITTVLPLLRLVENHTRLFRVRGTNPQPFGRPLNL